MNAPLIHRRCPLAPSRGERLWELAQRGLALGAIAAGAPVLGAIAAAVKLSSPGPVLFRQQRRGRGGVPFTVYKFRTMSLGSERATALGVQQSNPAVTRVGRVLRELKLDEVPQLWNVAKGDMALVGPRPIPIALEDELSRGIADFSRRQSVRPGLTNVAQVALHDNRVGDQLLEDWEERFEAELHYLRHRSPVYDAVVISLTALFVTRRLVRRWVPAPQAAPAQTVAATAILGVPISNLDYAGVIGQVAEWIATGERRYVGVCPVHSLMEAHWHPEHHASLRAADLNTADGTPVAWTQRLLGHRTASRVYGPTLMLKTLARAEQEGWRVAFYGGHPDRLETLQVRLRERFPRLRIVAAISPPFRALSEAERARDAQQLRAAKPDLIWVGLGSPKQEAWMRDHVGRIPGVLLGVGAAFDFHAGAVRQAPAWLQRHGLEWAFRLAMEPRRLFKRYATSNPGYVWALGKQLLGHVVHGASAQVAPRAAAPAATQRRVA